MNTRQAAVLVALILVVGGYAIVRQIAPEPPRYVFLPFKQNLGVYRGDLKTGEIQFYAMDKGKLKLWTRNSLPNSTLTDDQFRALGLDPATGEVADLALFNRALQKHGIENQR